MHPAFALTRTRLTDQAASAKWVRTVARASGIEGVYTGMENVMKEVLNVVDKGVFANPDSFHAQLLAQAAAKTDKRNEVIDKELYDKLDELRRFRHRERVNYRHVLKESFVNENLELLKKTFSSFEAQIIAFIESWENKPTEEDEPTSSHKI